MIPSTKMASVKRLVPGTPASDIPIPPRTACNNEMPITPRDTARMVAPERSANSSPCVEFDSERKRRRCRDQQRSRRKQESRDDH